MVVVHSISLRAEQEPIPIGDLDLTELPFVIPVGDFASWELPFNDPLLADESFITGFGVNIAGRDEDQVITLTETLHINILPVWDEYSGAGVIIATVEPYYWDHPDLQANSITNESYENRHGTGVAGIIAAEADNGIGGVGIAYGASFGYRSSMDAGGVDYDIRQSSAGGPNVPEINTFFPSGDVDLALTGRDGFGTIFVNSAGKGGRNDTSTEVYPRTSVFEIIPVAWANPHLGYSSGSSFGSSVHITGLTGDLTSDSLITTDLLGDAGFVNQDNAEEIFNLYQDLGGTNCLISVWIRGIISYFQGHPPLPLLCLAL